MALHALIFSYMSRSLVAPLLRFGLRAVHTAVHSGAAQACGFEPVKLSSGGFIATPTTSLLAFV